MKNSDVFGSVNQVFLDTAPIIYYLEKTSDFAEVALLIQYLNCEYLRKNIVN
jgi:hypothetical protein